MFDWIKSIPLTGSQPKQKFKLKRFLVIFTRREIEIESSELSLLQDND